MHSAGKYKDETRQDLASYEVDKNKLRKYKKKRKNTDKAW